MAITPADIEQKTFSEAKKHGYDTEEVDEFLDQLSAEVDAMLKKIKDLKDRLTASEQQVAASQAQIAQLKEQAAATPAPVVQAPAPVQSSVSASESQISRVLIIAQQSADQLVEDARNNAENIRNEADRKAREVIRQALAEKQNELDEIDRLKQSREDFRSEYKKLLQHFMDDADAVFPEQTLSTPSGSSYSAPAPQPAPNATVYAPASQPTQAKPALDDFDDFGDLD
ncbi:MAG: DivIVA domain-containing protein [Atopobiaceae bacterium]|jgi:cell division initiation protein|nr:DivIVA domain-containing protein [Atopobiaceae bacterium]